MGDYKIKNLADVEDSAAKFGFGHVGEARFPNTELEGEQVGLSEHRLNPNARQAFGHRHESTEEVYVVVEGSGRVRLDDEIVDVSARDAIRVGPDVVRAFEAGPDGLAVIAFSARNPDDRGEMLNDWWTD
jgi:mannose-6-phosphate isomerase-like protein (cupin superfamily)